MSQLLQVKWSRYIPTAPTAKQLAYICLPHEEALYGGAAGGGKTEALLMLALQYFDCPGYKGIIFRRKLTDHKLPSSILNRAKDWLAPFLASKEIKWVPGEHTMYSQEGGMLTFGYLDKEGSKDRYQSSEYSTICFDELTHFREHEYLYLFSRLRRTKGNADEALLPLRMRGATNPGGVGGPWVKKRFAISKDEDGQFRGHNARRPFIQARVRDNPFLDAEQYERSLGELDPVTRDRLKDGDWSASEDALFKDYWFENRYTVKGDYISFRHKDELKTYHKNQLFLFTAVDGAGSEKSGPEGRVFYLNQEACYSVCGTFAVTPDHFLLWWDNWRGQTDIPKFIQRVVEIHKFHRPTFSLIESNSIGQGIFQGIRAKGINVVPIPSTTDKIVRSTAAQIRSESGKIILPAYANWLEDLEEELFVWTGLKGEIDDQIDVLSLASEYVSHRSVGSEIESGVSGTSHQAVPIARGGLWSKPSAKLAVPIHKHLMRR
jgi:predicted phage terminase large subunit-like protein